MVLEQYEKASGQSVNLHKSAITFGSKVQSPVKTNIRHLLKIHNNGEGGKYLGLPEQISTKKTEVFKYIVDKIEQRTKSWQYKFLSEAGKEILIKTVALAMPVYTMNCFKLPKGTCDEINKVLARYWWSKGSQRGMHWMRLCLSKREGGLGFRDIAKFNKALLAKQVWRLMTNPTSLAARLLRERYHPSCSIVESGMDTKPSYLWRSLQDGKALLKKGLRCIVGSGSHIKVWSDPWLDTIPGSDFRELFVKDLILPNNRGWNISLLANIMVAEDVMEVSKIKLNTFASEDIIGWSHTNHGHYTVKSGYWLATQVDRMLRTSSPSSCELKQKIWRLKTAPKLKHFLWRLLTKTLAVGTTLKERGITDNIECRRCCSDEESFDHLFFTCPDVQAVWRAINYLYYQNRSFSWEETHQAILNDVTEWMQTNFAIQDGHL